MSESRRFRFVSWKYLAVALIVPIPLVFIGVLAMAEIPLLSVFLIGLPAIIAVAMLRRGVVSLALDGDRLVLRRGLLPSQTIMLPPATDGDGDDPYREGGDAPQAPAVRLEAGDHADFEMRNPTSRALAKFTKVVRFMFRVLSSDPGQRNLGEAVEVDEAMTELSLRDASGQLHRFVVPAQGKRNEAKLDALAKALEAAGHRPIGEPTR